MHRLAFALLFLIPIAITAVRWNDTEPYFNNDETRHVMTGVFVRDALMEGGWQSPKSFAVDYYFRMPALGLLVWPPGFYVVEGLWMSAFGTSYVSARILLLCFFAIALWYTFRLARLMLPMISACSATVLFGLSPIVVEFREHVMLEMPTLACLLGAMYHLEVFLSERKSRDAWLAGVFAAAGCWMRYDALLFGLLVVFRFALSWDWKALANRHVAGALLMTVMAVGPLYYFTWKEYGSGLSAAITVGTSPTSQAFSAARNLTYYPSEMLGQMGTPLAVASWAAAIYLLIVRPSGWMLHWSAILAVYCFFSPLPELEARHAIYWVPSFCIIVVRMLDEFRRTSPAMQALLVVATGLSGLQEPNFSVRGYRAAAAYIAEKSDSRTVCLFDGFLNGGFIYAIRELDPSRKWTVLRADKILFGVLSDPAGGYQEWKTTDEEILAEIHQFDPEYIVVEFPRVFHEIPASQRLSRLLANRKDWFQRETSFPVVSNHPLFEDRELIVYRKINRNPTPARLEEMKMMSLGRALAR